VGQYSVDLLVEQTPLVELKSTKASDEGHRAQCVNYLKATGRGLCLLLNFGKSKLEIKRVVNGLQSAICVNPRPSAVICVTVLSC
jgi:GxxExxY protein